MKLYNSMTRQKEEFVPIEPGHVKIYSCGPTVYNFFHIGNARTFVVVDILRSYLEYKGYEVKLVQNFTDIDDKLIKKANEEGCEVKDIAERYIKEYFTDARGMGVADATVHPRATENIDEIIAIISELESKGLAYALNGDVYYRARRFEGYGALSHQPIDELESGARIAADERKEDPIDFTLWKAAKPGEPYWDSPWGKGRPGWHIECSAMSRKYLGKTIDIHTGGVDLCFPHHENERAQSEGANGTEFVKYWFHVAFLNIDNKKMSKSLHNFTMAREAGEQYGYQPIRMFILSAHYRTPLNYSEDSLKMAAASLERIATAFESLRFLSENGKNGEMTEAEKMSAEKFAEFVGRFETAMDDDLNTADAVSVIFDLVRELNTVSSDASVTRAYAAEGLKVLTTLCKVLRIDPDEKKDDLDSQVEELIAARNAARASKNWAEADRIRDQLKDMGIVIKDTPQGVKWTKI